MTSEQPSLFDQLTPSDALRDDLDWLDSLQETKPSTPPRKPKNRRSNRKHGIEPVQHDDKHGTTTTPPTETTVPATGSGHVRVASRIRRRDRHDAGSTIHRRRKRPDGRERSGTFHAVQRHPSHAGVPTASTSGHGGCQRSGPRRRTPSPP